MNRIKTTTEVPPFDARLARERLSLEGQLPDGILRAEIDASWRRSLGHGVPLNSRHDFDLSSSANLDLLLASNRVLLDAATAEIDYLRARQGKDSVIILANADATILTIEGQADA